MTLIAKRSPENEAVMPPATDVSGEVKPHIKKVDSCIDDVNAFKNEGPIDKQVAIESANFDVAQELVRRVSLEATDTPTSISKCKNSGDKLMDPPATFPTVTSQIYTKQLTTAASFNKSDYIKVNTSQPSIKLDSAITDVPILVLQDSAQILRASSAETDNQVKAPIPVSSSLSTKTLSNVSSAQAISSSVSITQTVTQSAAIPPIPTHFVPVTQPATQCMPVSIEATQSTGKSSVILQNDHTSTITSQPTQTVMPPTTSHPTSYVSTQPSVQFTTQPIVQANTQPAAQSFVQTLGTPQQVMQPITQILTQSSSVLSQAQPMTQQSFGAQQPTIATQTGSRSVEPQNSLDLTSGQTSHENTMTLTRQQRNMMDFENLKQKLVQLSGSQKNTALSERTDDVKLMQSFVTSGIQQPMVPVSTITAMPSNIPAHTNKSTMEQHVFLPQTPYSQQHMFYPDLNGHPQSTLPANVPIYHDQTSSYNPCLQSDANLIMQQLQSATGPGANLHSGEYNVTQYGSTPQIPLGMHQSMQQLQQLALVIGQLQQQYPLLQSSLSILLNQQVASVLMSQPLPGQSSAIGSLNRSHFPPYTDHLLGRGTTRSTLNKPPEPLAVLEKSLIEKLHIHPAHPHRRIQSQPSHYAIPASPNSVLPQSPPQVLQSDSPMNVPRSPDHVERPISSNHVVRHMGNATSAGNTGIKFTQEMQSEDDTNKAVTTATEQSCLSVDNPSKSRFSVTLVEEEGVARPGTPVKDSSPAKVTRQNILEKNAKSQLSPTKPKLGSQVKKTKGKETREVTRKGRFHVTTVIKELDAVREPIKDDPPVSKVPPQSEAAPTVLQAIPHASTLPVEVPQVYTTSVTSSVCSVSTTTNVSTYPSTHKILQHSDSNLSITPVRSTIPVSTRRRQSVPILHLHDKHTFSASPMHHHSTEFIPALANSSCVTSSSLVHDSTLRTLYEVCYRCIYMCQRRDYSFYWKTFSFSKFG